MFRAGRQPCLAGGDGSRSSTCNSRDLQNGVWFILNETWESKKGIPAQLDKQRPSKGVANGKENGCATLFHPQKLSDHWRWGARFRRGVACPVGADPDRKSTRLNSS